MAEEVHNVGADNVPTSKPTVFMELTAQILVEAPNAIEAVHFYKDAFGAEEVDGSRNYHLKRKADQDIYLFSVELMIGPLHFLVCDILSDDESAAPVKTVGTEFCLITKNVEVVVENAVKAGAVLEGEFTDGCSGPGNKKLKDPFGNFWLICALGNIPSDMENFVARTIVEGLCRDIEKIMASSSHHK